MEDALLAAQLGSDAVGMVFAPSPRQVDRAVARDIASALPAHVDRVGVFQGQPREEILRRAGDAALTRIQLHGQESPEEYAALPGALTRALVGEPAGWPDEIRRWREIRPDVDFLVDLPKQAASDPRGLLAFWDRIRPLAKQWALILAGGLDPTNVGAALRSVQPIAVDVARGVEAHTGQKDPERLRLFFRAVLRHDAATGVQP